MTIGKRTSVQRLGAVSALWMAACAVPAWGQVEQQRLDRTLEQFRRETRDQPGFGQPIDQQLLFQYGAYAEVDYFSLDDRTHDNHGGREYALVPYFRLNLYDAHEVFFRARLDYRDFNPGDSFNGKQTEEIEPWLDRAYYRFDAARQIARDTGHTPDWDVALKGGRDLDYWANGLVISQVLDGGVIDANYGLLSVEGIGGVTVGHTVDFDTSRRHFDNDTRRGFFGGLLSATLGEHHPFIYAVSERDYNDDTSRLRITNPGGTATTIITRYDYNANYLGFGSTGALADRLSYGVELVYEGGTNLSNSFTTSSAGVAGIPQTRDSIRAYAGDIRFDYLPGDTHNSRISLEVLTSSGDSDRLSSSTNTFGGNKPHTADYAFNTLGLIDTGLAFAPAISNLTFVRAGASTFPAPNAEYFRRLQVGFDVFTYLKSDRKAPIEEPTSSRRYLGIEPDVYMNWRITSDVTFLLRYGVFLPAESIQSTHAARQFVFTGINVAF